MRAIRAASSPTRSRLAIVFEIAISRRRSRAVGWRRAMIVDRSRSISTSVWLTRSSVVEHLGGDVAAEGDERVDGARDLRLDHPAHLEDAGGDAAQLGVELGGKMAIVHGGSFSRSGR